MPFIWARQHFGVSLLLSRQYFPFNCCNSHAITQTESIGILIILMLLLLALRACDVLFPLFYTPWDIGKA